MPIPTERQRQARHVVIRMMLDLHEIVTARERPTEETLVRFAISLGQYEGKPVDATMIAAITALPRTSVLRHLKALENRGCTRSIRVGRRVVRYVPMEAEPPEITAFYEDAERAVRQACLELSKMDSSSARHKS